MRLVAITSASKPSIAINATQRAIRARITPCMARPPEPRRPPADEWFNSVHLWRRNRDGNEDSTGRICDEARRIAANIAKPLEVVRQLRTPSTVFEPSATGATSGVTGSDCRETVESGLVCFRSSASANVRMSSRHSRTSEVFAVIVSPSPKQLPQDFSCSIILPRLRRPAASRRPSPSRKPTPPERSDAVAQAFRHFSMAARSWVP